MGEVRRPGRLGKHRDILTGQRDLHMENVIGFREEAIFENQLEIRMTKACGERAKPEQNIMEVTFCSP